MENLEVGQVWRNLHIVRSIVEIKDGFIIYLDRRRHQSRSTEYTDNAAGFNLWIARTEAKLEGRDGY